MVIDRVPSVEMVSDPSAICFAAAPVVATTFGFAAAKVYRVMSLDTSLAPVIMLGTR